MIKNILFDADGMMVHRRMLFSERLAMEYHVPGELIQPFFENEFQLCVVGKADLKIMIQPYLSKWNWAGSVEDLLEYWFKNENEIDQRLIDAINAFRASGIKCYLHTNQEKYRADYMINVMGLGKIFDGLFLSAAMGVAKPTQEYWQTVFRKIQPVEKQEVLVWDDDAENMISAKNFGFKSELYTGFESFTQVMIKYEIRY